MNLLRKSTLLFAILVSLVATAFAQTVVIPSGITQESTQIKAGPANIDMTMRNMVMDIPVRHKMGA